MSKHSIVKSAGFFATTGMLVLFFGAAISYFFVQKIRRFDDIIKHTYEVQGSIQILATRLSNAGNGMLAYAMTGKEKFVQPYRLAASAYASDISALETLTTDSDEQHDALVKWEKVIRDYMLVLDTIVDRAKLNNSENFSKFLNKETSELLSRRAVLMQEILSQSQSMNQRELSLLKLHNDGFDAISKALWMLTVATVAVGGGLMTAGYMSIRKSFRQADVLRAELKTINSSLQTLFNAAMDCIIVMDKEGRVVRFNPAAEHTFGYKRDEIIGRMLGETIVPLKYREAHSEGLKHYLKTKKGPVLGKRVEFEGLRRDGSEFPVELEMDVARSDEDEQFVAFVRDITERKQSEEAINQYRLHLEELVSARTKELDDNKKLLETIIKTSPNGLLLADSECRIIMTNAALDQMFGYAQSELLNCKVEELVPEFGRDRHREQRNEFLLKSLDASTRKGLDLSGQRKDGSVFPVDISLSSFFLGESRYVQATVVDISARKQSERELRDLNANLELKVAERTDELAAASAAKSAFLAHMSHEIRTPMNGILGLTQLLERASLDSEHRDMVLRIHQAGQSLLAIISDILDFSKIEAGELRIETAPFQLTKIVFQVQSLLGVVAHGKGDELTVDISPDLEKILMGDALRVEQVLMNLVGNAIKFTEHGRVHVRVRRLAQTDSTYRVRFEVEDNGIGISRDHIGRLFTPFSQADESITRRFGGSGLGLSISRRLVKLMSGDIGVESVLGKGSTFWFELPFTLSEEQISHRANSLSRPPGGEARLAGVKCLVVDDSRMNRDVVERMLHLEGATVSLAADGQQALELLRAQEDFFDAVLMDIQMPVMDGLTAARMIRKDIQLKTLPIIALTAGVLTEQRGEALDAGCNDFVAKPVDLEELIAVLIRWTRQDPEVKSTPVEEPSMDFPDIPGLNIPRACAYVSNNKDLLVDLLRNFLDEFDTVGVRVHEALQKGDSENAARHLHALRGAAGYIGAEDVGKKAELLESAILEGHENVAVMADEFSADLTSLIESISCAMHL